MFTQITTCHAIQYAYILLYLHIRNQVQRDANYYKLLYRFQFSNILWETFITNTSYINVGRFQTSTLKHQELASSTSGPPRLFYK